MINKMILPMAFTLAIAIFLHVTVHATDISETRSTLEEWVLVEKTISAEREQWIADKVTTEDLIGLLRAESASLKEQFEQAQSATTVAEALRGVLLEERAKLDETSAVLNDEIVKYEKAIRELAPKLPSPLLEQIRPLLQRVPQSGKPTSLSLGQRMQSIVGILGEVDKFNGSVTLFTEIQELPDGRSAEVQVLYFGLGAAFFADASGNYAGVMTPGDSGWVPSIRKDLASSINEAIAQHQRLNQAAFIQLPFEVK